MISVEFTPDPPGEPGLKVQYYFARRRYRIVAPLVIGMSLFLGLSAWLTWNGGDGASRTLAVLAFLLFVCGIAFWQLAAKRSDRLYREIREASLLKDRHGDPKLMVGRADVPTNDARPSKKH